MASQHHAKKFHGTPVTFNAFFDFSKLVCTTSIFFYHFKLEVKMFNLQRGLQVKVRTVGQWYHHTIES